MQLHPAEEATVRAFMTAPNRDRFLQLLASGKRRGKVLNEFNHFAGWDERYVTRLPPSANARTVLELLEDASAPLVCHVISDDTDLDGQDLPLDEAVDRAEAFDFASVLCCDPGRLAFFFDEATVDRRRLLLRRRASRR